MKKFMVIIFSSLLLFGCSNNNDKASDDNTSNVKAVESRVNDSPEKPVEEGTSLVSEMQEIMSKNGYVKQEEILDYELKGDYLFVLNYNTTKGTDVIILKNDSGKLEWIKAIDTGSATLISADENATKENDNGPFILVVQPEDSKVTGVKTFGEYAKMIQVTRSINDSLTKDIKLWVYVTDELDINPQDFVSKMDQEIEYLYTP
ncbi:hypothetical protein [Falsibacillus pallidus]|uniref:hypothetical protein n=1 Tax=Falsibacillus pallidus TaxID=493781 RepID=UPI003D959AD3